MKNFEEGTFEPVAYKRWFYWLRWKHAQELVRTHSSLAMAIALAVLVVAHDWRVLSRPFTLLTPQEWILSVLLITTPVLFTRFKWIFIIRKHHVSTAEWALVTMALVALAYFIATTGRNFSTHVRSPHNLFDIGVVVITFGTIAAAVYELVGEKVSSSPRDRLFAISVRRLLEGLDQFNASGADAGEVLYGFTKELLNAACDVLCGSIPVTGAYLRADDRTGTLSISASSKGAKYDPNLRIPIWGDMSGPGPAAQTFKQAQTQRYLAYVPEKEITRDERENQTEAWLLELTKQERYKLDPKEVGWVNASDPSLEQFRTTLCLPIRFNKSNGKQKNVGVLTFSTANRDPFLRPDFVMAECFAQILEQAIRTASCVANQEG